ncbi:uncharacterized protein N7496_005457 [Penicillium cataractarum]|uniref:Uncharacterized protein n=1 Tax=Penicillium cataractarum TaxID=2100454 RepID=A0A9W9SG96_9EURO|nr:uncharacterized protein N7496_005457 [Penicillium cataractarum]KAJ5378048.1 hypothetical protein N7496_005457 [Penicillium cataractarum]
MPSTSIYNTEEMARGRTRYREDDALETITFDDALGLSLDSPEESLEEDSDDEGPASVTSKNRDSWPSWPETTFLKTYPMRSPVEFDSSGIDFKTSPINFNTITMPDEDSRITSIATTASEHITALRLVADSVAQQRQLAARAILFDPICLALLPLVPAGMYYSPYKDRIDILTILLLSTGALMAFGSIVKWSLGGYLDAAERVGTWRWLYGLEDDNATKMRGHYQGGVSNKRYDGEQVQVRSIHSKRDIVLVTRPDPFGEIIGTIILRIVPITRVSRLSTGSNSSQKRRLNTPRSMRDCKAIIRAWTVKQSHRGAGIGAWMLKDAIELCLQYGWVGPEFAMDHANSVRVLPQLFNGWLDAMEARAKKRLRRDIATLTAALEVADGSAMPGVL